MHKCTTITPPNRSHATARAEIQYLHAIAIDRILRKYAHVARLDHSYSAHSMRATFINTALNNGASPEDVQWDVGHVNPTTTKLYGRRGHNPEKAAAFFSVY
jgi:integrase/recombinase XerD